MNRAFAPPAPHLVGGKREVRREKAQQGLERNRESRASRGCGAFASRTVCAILHELNVVITERPEERLDDLDRTCVVKLRHCRARLIHDAREGGEHRAVERLGDSGWVRRKGALRVRRHFAKAERKLRGVENLDREAPADLHLALFERRVRSLAGTCRPVAHAIRTVLFEKVDRRHDIAFRL